jgi:hypothetical protein
MLPHIGLGWNHESILYLLFYNNIKLLLIFVASSVRIKVTTLSLGQINLSHPICQALFNEGKKDTEAHYSGSGAVKR